MMRRPLIRSSDLNRRSREGVSAVEFAMVAFPFFFMMFAIIEVGVIFVTDSMLANASMETGRLVRTGQASKSSLTADQFKAKFCSRMSIFSGQCSGRLTVDVREIPQFRNQTPPDPTANGTFDTSKLTYQTGKPGSLMLIRVWYRQPLFTPFLAQSLSKLKDGKMVMMATTSFRNEPYDQ